VKDHKVKDMMVPLSEYATVSKDATLLDAVNALKKAQAGFDQTRYRHRAVLVYDDNKKIVGKLSQMDILRALEPKYDEMLSHKRSFGLGFTRKFQKSMLEQLRLWDAPMEHICQKAAGKKVSTFMYTPEDEEIVSSDASLNEAIHQLVIGHHQSLLVMEKNDIVGILRLTDVFSAIADAISVCEI